MTTKPLTLQEPSRKERVSAERDPLDNIVSEAIRHEMTNLKALQKYWNERMKEGETGRFRMMASAEACWVMRTSLGRLLSDIEGIKRHTFIGEKGAVWDAVDLRAPTK